MTDCNRKYQRSGTPKNLLSDLPFLLAIVSSTFSSSSVLGQAKKKLPELAPIGGPVATVQRPGDPGRYIPHTVIFSPSGEHALIHNDVGTVLVDTVASKDIVARLPGPKQSRRVESRIMGGKVITPGGIEILDVALVTAVFDSEGKTITGIDPLGNLLRWDKSGGPIGKSVPVGASFADIKNGLAVGANCLSADGKKVFLWSMKPFTGVRNTSGSGPSVPLQLPKGSYGVGGICFSPDGKVVCTTIGNVGGGGAALWNTSTGKQIGKVMKHPAAKLWAVFSSDGTAVATGDDKGNVLLWDAATGAPRGDPVAPTNYLDLRHDQAKQFQFSPDSTKLMHVTPAGVLRIRDALTGKVLKESKSADPQYLGLSVDGKRAVVRDKKGIGIWLWDVEHDEALAKLLMPKEASGGYYAVFSPNRGTLAVAFDADSPTPMTGWLLWKLNKQDQKE
jgi:WD40 repeat protein